MNEIDREVLVAAFTGEASEEERRRLREWRAADEANEQEYRRLRRLWDLAGSLEPASAVQRAPTAEDVVSLARRRSGEPRLEPRPAPRDLDTGRGWSPGWSAAAMAALLVLGLGLGVLWSERGQPQRFGPQELVTGANEVTTVALEDETVVRLAPDSRLRFLDNGGPREVALQGRAYFAVARRPGQPFRVRLPGGDIEVLGTRFDVNGRDGRLEVAVVEGSVRMAAQGRRLDVGTNQVARTTERGVPEVRRVDDVFGHIDWLGRFLAFESTPLDQVAEEFERRFGIRVQVADTALRERTVTGWFADQSPEQMIAAICRAVDARCTVRDGSVRMEVASRGAGGSVLAAEARERR